VETSSRNRSARGIERDRLRGLVDAGLLLRRIASELGVSCTAVQYWLGKHGITTPRARRLAETAPARLAGAETTEAECPTHGVTTFIRRGADGFRCRLCRAVLELPRGGEAGDLELPPSLLL
jgi:hypothetical protein